MPHPQPPLLLLLFLPDLGITVWVVFLLIPLLQSEREREKVRRKSELWERLSDAPMGPTKSLQFHLQDVSIVTDTSIDTWADHGEIGSVFSSYLFWYEVIIAKIMKCMGAGVVGIIFSLACVLSYSKCQEIVTSPPWRETSTAREVDFPNPRRAGWTTLGISTTCMCYMLPNEKYRGLYNV